jgi:glucokinase
MRLIGDIGGTNARFALAGDGVLLETSIQVSRTAAHPSLLDALHRFLQTRDCTQIDSVRLAIAGPVAGDRIAMTNAAWQFSVTQLEQTLRDELLPNLDSLRVLNDFEAQAVALPHLRDTQLINIGGTAPHAGCKSVIGPGTGFGAATLAVENGRSIVLASEGGHAGIAPQDETDLFIHRWLLRQDLPVTREQLLSGAGLQRLHQALGELAQTSGGTPPLRASEIVDAALAGDTLCQQTLQRFCALLGSAARDQALICGARGGIYISGGIVMHFIDTLLHSEFRARFEASTHMAPYLRDIPTYLITTPYTGLIGAAHAA